MVSEYDVLSKFTQFKWASIPLTAVTITNSITPRLETNQYLDGRTDHLRYFGHNSKTFDCELIFDSTLGNFPVDYRSFLKKIVDGTPHYLEHPILGEILTFCSVYTDTITVTNRSGIRVNCTFTETYEKEKPELVDFLNEYQPLTFSEITAAEAYREPDPLEEPDLFDLLNDIEKLKAQLSGTKSILKTRVNTIKNKIKTASFGTIDWVKKNLEEDYDDHEKGVAAIKREYDNSARRRQKELERAVYLTDQARKTIQENETTNDENYKEYITEYVMSVWELSAKLGDSVGSIFTNNPELKGKLVIPTNTVVKYNVTVTNGN